MSYLNADRLNPEDKKKFHLGEPGDAFVADSNVSIEGKRCLVLDDEFLIALDIQQILETAGATSVVCAGNSADALAALRTDMKFDFAVLDLMLSDATRTSLTVATVLANQGTPFVFLTGMRAEDVYIAQFPDAPVLEKPYEAAMLLEAVALALKAT